MQLPETSDRFIELDWKQIESFYKELLERPITTDNIQQWLDDWTRLHALIDESYASLHVSSAVDTRDVEAEKKFQKYIENIYLKSQPHETRLKSKLVDSVIQPPGFIRPLDNMRTDIELFREENLPLFAESETLSSEYSRTIGAQTVDWQGRELTIQQLRPVFQDPDREKRESAWKLVVKRQLKDREKLNALWRKFLAIRRKMAANAGVRDYRTFRWKQLRRFDYSPEDCSEFRKAIAKVVVPAASRIYRSREKRLGLDDTLRPWDIDAQPKGEKPLRPFETIDQFEERANMIFSNVDHELGDQFRIMREEKLLDLDNRVGKAPGGFCTFFPVRRRPFIFMNAVGVQDDVRTLLHEAGHCFHDFAVPRWHQQWEFGTEFAEVASMSMELLASPFLEKSEGGYYSRRDAARARITHLENNILFWPYMAVVDAFQHWAYTQPDAADDPGRCDAQWAGLWDSFMPGIDYSGYEDVKKTGWHRKLHIFQYPFYYVEYGLAQLGAVQVWENALKDQATAVKHYRESLALGAQPLPILFEKAGAKFTFDADTLSRAVDFMERVIQELLPLTE
jgi:oligoendopeptidase F